jgi:hypothetical protein
MNLNTAAQHNGVIAWSGLAAPVNVDVDIRQHNSFSYTFLVDSDITADALFEFKSAPPDPTDNCVADTTKYAEIPELVMCSMNGEIASPTSQIIFPAGTKKGTFCTATLSCRPDAFVRLFAVSGDVGRITAVCVLSGPR